ncbi:uncharacterized protein LOC131685658 [Topomyia yanbarensis]|uniref:uncharacterized protein LOC131685658 n=1 Tax=Topomyia yanbarensis TaxID=2498891 RepID=UPI00273C0E85|nr:uncharacterized protein LOC131685658 [Topomyia yanbarensis]
MRRIQMPRRCIVNGCGAVYGKVKTGFHRFPMGNIAREEFRRTQWLVALSMNPQNVDNCYVCGQHFHGGKPAAPNAMQHPDWIPTLNIMRNDDNDQSNYFTLCNNLPDMNNNGDCEPAENQMCDPSEETVQILTTPEDCEEEWLDNPTENITDVPNINFTDESISTCTSEHPSVQRNDNATDTTISLHEKIRQYEEVMRQQADEINQLKRIISKQQTILQCFSYDLDSFKNNDSKVKHLTGFTSFETLELVFQFVEPGILVFSDVLSKAQVFIMVLMYLRLGLCFQTLAYLFRVCPSTIAKYFYSGIYSLFKQLKGLVRWPTGEIINSNTPPKFHKLYNAPIAVILDCFEVFTEKPGVKDSIVKMYSSYKHHYTVKEMIGITSFGSISFISKPYSGRSSDKYITENCGFLDKLMENDIVLADRGFTIREAVEQRGAVLKVPDSASKKQQMSSTAVERTRALAAVRIEIERTIGALRQKTGILSTRLPITLLNHEHNGENVLNMIVTVACAIFNLCPSIVSQN